MKIDKLVTIDFGFLDHAHFPMKVRECVLNLKDHCDSNYGYIVSISKYEITDTFISRATNEVLVKLAVWVEAMKPTVGQTYNAIVSVCVSGNGIYAQIMGKIRVRIAERTLNEKYKFVSDSYVSIDKKRIIGPGCAISIIISATKYEDGNFLCIGTLKN